MINEHTITTPDVQSIELESGGGGVKWLDN